MGNKYTLDSNSTAGLVGKEMKNGEQKTVFSLSSVRVRALRVYSHTTPARGQEAPLSEEKASQLA